MSVTDSKVTAPVGLAELASLLGEKMDVGVVCSSSNIQKYAKYKPLIGGSMKILTDADRYNLNHGFTPKFITIDVNDTPANMPEWGQWKAPSDGNWLRLTDFVSGDKPTTVGYNHLAKPYIKEVKYSTNHSDGQSLILNDSTLTNDQRVKGLLNIKIGINPDADLKYSDFHFDSGIGGDIVNFYWCAALVCPWLIPSGTTSAAIIGYSDRTIGELEQYNPNGDAVEFSFETAPNSAFYSAMKGGHPMFLIIGLTKSKNLATQIGSPFQLLSPVIFSDWLNYNWIKKYTTSKFWTGQVATQQYYFNGGVASMYEGAYVNTPTQSSQTWGVTLTNLHFLVKSVSNSLTPASRLTFRLYLKKDGSNNFIDKRGVIISPFPADGAKYNTSNHFFEGEVITQFVFKDEVTQIDTTVITGKYSGYLELTVEGAEIITQYINNEVASKENWIRQGDLTDGSTVYVQSFSIGINFTLNS